MGPKGYQRLTYGILIVGGAALLTAGYTLGGAVAIAVGVLAGFRMFGPRP